MSGLRDYETWHQAYDDPSSGLSWRLGVVRDHIRHALDEREGPVRVLSLCSGDGRDVLDVLAERSDADRVLTTLVELHPAIAQAARERADRAGVLGVEVRTADAGDTSSWADAAPADVVLLVGIFGNVSDEDLEQTIAASPQLCRPGATLVWSRGQDTDDRTDAVRGWFAEAGFTEIDHVSLDSGSRPGVGCVRYTGPAQPLVAGRLVFTFWR